MEEKIVILESQGQSTFTTRLETPLYFGLTEYECALTQVSLPKTWHTVFPSQCHFAFFGGSMSSEVDHTPIKDRMKLYSIHSGRYTKPEDLLTALRLAIPEEGRQNVVFHYNRFSGKISIHLSNNALISFDTAQLFGIHSSLGSLLGFSTTGILSGNVTSHVPVSIETTQNIFIYCDLIKPIRLADTLAPLLAIVSVNDDNTRKYIHERYQFPNYLEISRREITHISIKICHNSGEEIQFNGGLVFLKLSFRPRS
jgi:hypothetical protein